MYSPPKCRAVSSRVVFIEMPCSVYGFAAKENGTDKIVGGLDYVDSPPHHTTTDTQISFLML